MTPEELRHIANAPGYGTAQKELRKAGKWDDTAILDGRTLYSVTVDVSGTYSPEVQTETYTVTAATEAEAMEKADAMCGFENVHDCEVVKVSELPT